MSEDYSGWKNYATWVTNLWLDNTQESQEYVSLMAKEAYTDAVADKYFTREERAYAQLADVLKEYHEENKPEIDGVYADLLNAAISDIDFYEIAQHYIDNLESKVEREA